MHKVLPLSAASILLLIAGSCFAQVETCDNPINVPYLAQDPAYLPPTIDSNTVIATANANADGIDSIPSRASVTDRQRISQLCNAHDLPDSECKVKWIPVLTQSLQWLAIQHEGNWSMEYWMRYETFHEPYWKGYKKALAGWRWTRWNDDDPFLDDYVGHPIMGASPSAIYIQNDPKSLAPQFGETKYW